MSDKLRGSSGSTQKSHQDILVFLQEGVRLTAFCLLGLLLDELFKIQYKLFSHVGNTGFNFNITIVHLMVFAFHLIVMLILKLKV